MNLSQDNEPIINFVKDPKTIAKAVEGSMAKRQAVLDNAALRELNRAMKAIYLELPAAVADDVNRIVYATLAAEQTRLKAEAITATKEAYFTGRHDGKADLIAKVRESLPEKVATAYGHKMQNPDLPKGIQGFVTSYENNIGYNMALAQVTAALDTLERGA